MILFKQASDLSRYLTGEKARHQVTGFVPTMGALHKGHLDLVQKSRQQASITIVSIFVNPTQFNNASDYQKYPLTLEKDINLLEEAGADILFLPSIEEMYPKGTQNLEKYDLGYLETVLEGQYRPGHFQGVCQVMSRLLTMVSPHLLFMGQKDYQQCMVIKQLLRLMNSGIQLIICPTVREPDGLAMSSRNLRLNEEDRKKAIGIYQCLQYIKQQPNKKDWPEIQKVAKLVLEQKGFKVDYVELADADNLTLVKKPGSHTRLVALVAAYLNDVRLIDNMII